MQKIASPQELQAEIKAIMAFVHASEKPDRQVVASKLRELAGRLAVAKVAGKPSKGQKDKVTYGGPRGGDETFKVLRVFPTKDDADGPLPKNLLRLIKKGGGAALVELLPSGDYKVKGDMLIAPDSSKPRHYIRAFGPSGSWDGFPVALKPPQLKRLHSYKEAGDYDRTAAAKSLGRPDVLHGMKFGGTRYKYDFGIFIDHVEKDDTFHVNQAGRPTKKLGTAKSLKDAEKIALKKGDLSWT